jgi:hypothetical protein
MMTWILIGGLLAIAGLLGLALYACYRAGWENGYEEGLGDALERKPVLEDAPLEDARLEGKARGRHAMSQPRAGLPLRPAAALPEPKPARVALARSGYRDSWYQVFHDTPAKAASRAAVTAADIPPVFWPPQASPSKHGAAETGRMLQLSDVSTTGGFRAVNDDYIARMQIEEADYRQQREAEDAAYRDSDHRWESVTL